MKLIVFLMLITVCLIHSSCSPLCTTVCWKLEFWINIFCIFLHWTRNLNHILLYLWIFSVRFHENFTHFSCSHWLIYTIQVHEDFTYFISECFDSYSESAEDHQPFGLHSSEQNNTAYVFKLKLSSCAL